MERRVALVGELEPSVVAHQAIPQALELAARDVRVEVSWEWVSTDSLARDTSGLSAFSGLWCVPNSPYRSTQGALAAIRRAREAELPFLGTCGGFQYALLEIAESLWGVERALHAELHSSAIDPVIAPLMCSLVEQSGEVRFEETSRLARAYGQLSARAQYHCSYGLSSQYYKYLDTGPLRATAWDEESDVRGVELDAHPFFVATLFQPERSALLGITPPIVREFINALVA